MKIFPKFLLLVLCALSLPLACSDEQDFSQFEDLGIIPTAEASLLFVEVPEEIINLAGGGLNFYIQTFNFDAFEEEFLLKMFSMEPLHMKWRIPPANLLTLLLSFWMQEVMYWTPRISM